MLRAATYVAGGDPEVTASSARLLPLTTFFKTESSFWRGDRRGELPRAGF